MFEYDNKVLCHVLYACLSLLFPPRATWGIPLPKFDFCHSWFSFAAITQWILYIDALVHSFFAKSCQNLYCNYEEFPLYFGPTLCFDSCLFILCSGLWFGVLDLLFGLYGLFSVLTSQLFCSVVSGLPN